MRCQRLTWMVIRVCGELPTLTIDGVRMVVSYQRLPRMVWRVCDERHQRLKLMVLRVCGELPTLKRGGAQDLRWGGGLGSCGI